MKSKVQKCKIHGDTVFSFRKNGRYRCRKCCVIAVQKRRISLKEKLVDYFGGACEVCGYSKYIGALQFHHINPDTKEFRISMGNIKSFERALKEAVKCSLVCTRCHDEIHGGIIENLKIDENRKDRLFKRFEDETNRKINKCINCKTKTKNNKYCSQQCVHKSLERTEWPENLRELVEQHSKRYIAKLLGVSDKAVAKRLKRYSPLAQ